MRKIIILLLIILLLSGCAKQPIEKEITPSTNSIEFGEKIIIGQFIHYGTKKEFMSHYTEHINNLEKETGHRPGMVSINLHDMTTGEFVDDPDFVIDGISEEWHRGVITYIGLIAPNPVTGYGQYAREETDPYPEDLALVYTEGTTLNQNFKQSLDKAANIIGELKKQDVVVLLEPINELGIGHYWYSWDDPEELVKLYSYTYDYMTQEKGLDNIIWVIEFIGNLQEVPVDLTPIKNKIDIIGLSIYDSDPGDKYRGLIDSLAYLDKPIAFSEFGPDIKKSPDKLTRENFQYNSWDNLILADALEQHYPDVVFVLRWSSVWSIVHQKNAKEFMERLN